MTGATGATGITGATGPQGTLASAYLGAYTSANTVIGALSPVSFDTIESSLDITPLGLFNTSFLVASSGTYLVTIGVAGSNAGVTVQLQVNAVPTGPAITLEASGAGMSGGSTQILTLNGADTLELENTSVGLLNDDVGSSISIVRIA